MPRALGLGQLAALQGEHLRRCGFIDIDFVTVGVKGWNLSPFDYVVTHGEEDPITYLGGGTFMQVSALEQSRDMIASDLTISLSGIDPGVISGAIEEPIQGRRMRLWEAVLDEGNQIIGGLIGVWDGRIDYATYAVGETATVDVVGRSRFADWFRAPSRRYTQGQLQSEYPEDTGLRYIPLTRDMQINWGG